MKNVPIKFRGRFWLKGDYTQTSRSDGEFVYGGYARLKLLLDEGEGDFILIDEDQTSLIALLVYPDSVAQLVGYDVNGDEVYEGDILCAPYDNSLHFQAGVTYLQVVCDDFGTKIILDSDSVKGYKLKLQKLTKDEK